MTIRGLLLDLDGVIATGGTPLPGALEALQRIQAAGLPMRILTNGTLYSRAQTAAWMQAAGAPITAEMLLTPAAATVAWLRTQHNPSLYLLTHSNLHAEFQDFPIVEGDRGATAVIVGDMEEELSIDKLNGALRQLLGGATLIGLGMGRYWRGADGLRLDSGPITKGLEYAAGVHALVMGKPARFTFESGAAALGLSPGEVAMVGDDVLSDVGAAQEVGLLGILVRTGKFHPADLQRGVIPDAVVPSLAEVPTLLGLP